MSEAGQRYATALFDLALESNQLKETETALKDFVAAVAESSEFDGMLTSPLYSTEDKGAAIAALAEKLGLNDLVKRFLGVAAANRRAQDILDAALAFSQLYARHRGAQKAVARSAYPLTDEQISEIRSLVSTAVGGDAELDIEIDPELIGGLQLQIGSRLIDASLRAKLDGMNTAMKGA